MGEDQRRDLLMELYNFIRDGNLEDDLLMRHRKLSILSSQLFSLNKVFATYNSSEILDSARREAVDFLRDFCFRLPSLKLVHTATPMSGAIDVSRLHSLTHLEIGKAPVHLLTGLRALRQQLQVLICTRSLHSVEILVGKCGGDMAEEQNWPHLETLDLSFNYLTNLDTSLQFLPSLRVLDLSHNQIQNTGTHLECLPELQHLNLSYNSLSRAPSLGQVSHRKLKSLGLRNNNLHYLDGVHLYENLEFLDISRNCIYAEQTLQSLNYVWQISKIHFRGNPIAFEPLYRQMVTKNLPPDSAFREIHLDGRPLSEAEIKMIPTQRRSVFHPYPTGEDQSASAVSKAVQFGEVSVDSFEDSADYSSSGPSKQFRAKGKRKKKSKVRRVVLSEQAQREQLPTITPKSFEDSHLEDAKREFERKREELGSDWLLALQEPYKQPTEPTSSKNPFEDSRRGTNHSESVRAPNKLPERNAVRHDTATGQESHVPDQNIVVSAEIEATNGHPTNQCFVQAVELEKQIYLEAEMEIQPVENGVEARLLQDIAEVESSSTVAAVDGLDEQVEQSGHITEADNEATDTPLELGHLKGTSEALPLRGVEDVEAEDELQRCSSEEDLCGPLLVRVPCSNGFIEIFLTVKQTHLEESDQDGDVQEQLELKSLLSVDVLDKQVPDEGLVPVVSLNFDYVRKDRRSRNYYMEDHSSAENLSGVLEAFSHENQRRTVTQYMSCLKCAKEFPLSKAAMIVDRPKSRKSSDQQDNALNEVPTCPFCGNRYLVEGEQSSAARNDHRSSIVGSLTASTKPLATSSPWKPKENGQESTSLGLSSRFLADTPLPSKPAASQDPVSSEDATPNDSMTSETLDVSLRLPESTIPPDSLDAKTPIEEVAHYSRDQLDNLLKTDDADFRRRYSLVQEVSVDESINRTSSVASQPEGFQPPGRGAPASRGSSLPKDEMIHATGMRESVKNADEDIYGGGGSEEDEIDILDDPREGRIASQGESEVPLSYLRAAQKARGAILAKEVSRDARHDSNESDIAVLSDRERHDSDEPRAWLEGSSTSGDNVFGRTEVDSSAYHSGKDVSKPWSEREDDEHGSDFQSSDERRQTGDSGINGSSTSPAKDKRKERKISLLGNIQENFRVADHRLKLFYSMSLFTSDHEEFQGHISGSICANSMLGYVSYEGLVVVSTSHLYVLKVIKEESDKAADFLNKKLQSSLGELVYVHVGLGSQLIQFEFTPEGGGRFTLLIGDKFNVENFVKLLEESFKRRDIPKFKGFHKHEASSKNILVDLLDIGDELEDWSEMFYVHGLDTKSKDCSYTRRGILLTAQFIYLIEENCSWPLMADKSQGKVPAKGKHFTLKEHFSITDITDVDCNLRELKVFINFSDEDEEKEDQWELKMLTASSMRQMLNAINKPWSEQFGVDLTVSYIGTESTTT